MSPNRFLIPFLLPLLAACPAKSKSPLLFLGEMSASASLPTDWVQDAYLKASNAGAGDLFGWSVAISGNTIVIGAYQEGNSSTAINNTDNAVIVDEGTASSSGAAYVFKKDDSGNWIQDAYLKASNAGEFDRFGHSVAISDNTIVVGAPWEANSSTAINNTDNATIADEGTASQSGSAYVFKKTGSGSWIQDAYLKASNAGNGDSFGWSVAISDDTIIVGPLQEGNSSTAINNIDNAVIVDAGTASSSGAAYVFRKDGSGNWIQDAYLKASNAGEFDFFGKSVAISGNTIVVGAIEEDSSATVIDNTDNAPLTDEDTAPASGAAYVLKKDDSGNWIQDAYLKASNAGSGGSFGISVSVSNDAIVVGAYTESSSSTAINNVDNATIVDEGPAYGSGAVYVFKKDATGNWLQDAYLKASNAGADDLFGSSVAISGNTIVVGAYQEDNGSTDINNTDNASITDAGTASQSGVVYVFKKDDSGNWIQDAYLKASNAGTDDEFGWSVAISGTIVVVGAFLEDNSPTAVNNADNATIVDEGTATNSGAAYIFTLK